MSKPLHATADRATAIKNANEAGQPVLARALLHLHDPYQAWFDEEGDRRTKPDLIMRVVTQMAVDLAASLLVHGTDPEVDEDNVGVMVGNYERLLREGLTNIRKQMRRDAQ